MKRNNILFFTILLFISAAASSCEAIGDIFKAGFWGGIIIAALVVGLILWLINKAKK
jgi:hypothetical protein